MSGAAETEPGETDAAVIGAGLAGLAAAAVLAEGGARTLVIDERAAPGGLSPARAEAAALLARCRAAGATYWPAATAWHLTQDRTLWVSRGGRSRAIRAGIVVLATGAMERPLPLPGWTLPGVFAAGGLGSLMAGAGLVPAGRLVLIGCGALLYDMALQCLDRGAPPAALLDITPPGRLAGLHARRAAAGAAARDAYLRAAVARRLALRRAGVRVLGGVAGCRILGAGAVSSVAFARGGREETMAADMVGLHAGLVPATQFARLIGCRLRWHAAAACFVPETDRFGRSSVAGVLIAGDAAGIEPGGAQAGGAMAGWEALRQLGRIDAAERDRQGAPLRRERAAARAIGRLRAQFDRPDAAALCPADAVTVCRCEEVTAGAIRAAVAGGVRRTDELKGVLRCGMGPCQGRMCAEAAAGLVAEGSGRTMDEVGLFRVRVPLKPIAMREMAG